LQGVWNWDRFELFEANFEVCKTNMFVDAGVKDAILGQMYVSKPPTRLCSFEFKLQRLQLCQEKEQFLAIQSSISTDIGEIDGDDIYKYCFRCLTGNPSDSCVYRKPTDNDKNKNPYLIIKHTIAGSKLGLNYLETQYTDFKKRMALYFHKCRIVWVL